MAEDLGIPHIACVVGTDFSRGFFGPSERYAFESAVVRTNCVVAFNREQARRIRLMAPDCRVEVIHPGIEQMSPFPPPSRPAPPLVSLFSDSGYSYKKGTQILLWAFSILVREGAPIELTICGGTSKKQEKYWQNLRSSFSEEFGGRVEFHDFLSLSEVGCYLSKASVYCSPTLGEGCSNARVAALCAGLPMVTTACGEMNDVASNVNHVYLVPPGDPDAYLSALRLACRDCLQGKLLVERAHVEEWRNYFTFQREVSQWEALLATV